jgi:hypothetical protein
MPLFDMGEGGAVAKLREVEGGVGRVGGNNGSNRQLEECL